MKYFIIQARIGPNEFFETVECKSIGEALIEFNEYCQEMFPGYVVNVYAVSQAVTDINLEDVILN
jgi:hypothetical protein